MKNAILILIVLLWKAIDWKKWNRIKREAKLLKTERLAGTPIVDPIRGTNEAWHTEALYAIRKTYFVETPKP